MVWRHPICLEAWTTEMVSGQCSTWCLYFSRSSHSHTINSFLERMGQDTTSASPTAPTRHTTFREVLGSPSAAAGS
ncbi:hypothetical protein LEMLEM_LOCUS6051 [Lemmus lemmus]